MCVKLGIKRESIIVVNSYIILPDVSGALNKLCIGLCQFDCSGFMYVFMPLNFTCIYMPLGTVLSFTVGVFS